MKLLNVIKLYLSSFILFVLLDFIWLGFLARDFYARQLEGLLAPEANLIAAGIFYALYIAGLLYFVVLPALKAKHIATFKVVFAGALFGLVTYATYELTSLATLANWPLLIVFVDLIWGSFLTANIAAISFLIGQRLK